MPTIVEDIPTTPEVKVQISENTNDKIEEIELEHLTIRIEST
jgi:hypothetical protein